MSDEKPTEEQTEAPTVSEPATAPEPRPGPKPLQTSFAGRTVAPGDMVVGRIVKIAGSVAFVNYGARNEGYIELGELRGEDGELVADVGSDVEAQVIETRGAVRLSYRKAQVNKVRDALRDAWKNQLPVKGRIIGINKGGFEVRVEGVRAFCPQSQVADRPPREPARLVGNEYDFMITEFAEKKSLVVSRRAFMERSKAALKESLATTYRAGDRLQGRVTQLRDFGAFVEIAEGIEGLIHVSEISHQHIKHPNERLAVGDAVEVEVKAVDVERGRVGLSMKALESDPVTEFLDGVQIGAELKGSVVRLQEFGAFVNIAPGVDGLLHVSGISAERRIEHPSQVYTVGESVTVVVEKVDRKTRKVGLVTPEVAEARKPVDVSFKVGDILKGPVKRVEPFGVFIELVGNVVGLCPNAEMATDRGTDHRRMFPVGTELEVKVLEIDKKRNRIRVSRKALIHHDEHTAFDDYKKEQSATGGTGLGTLGDLFGDLLKK